MACRIGMATDVAARVKELKDEGKVPVRATYKTLISGLTYYEAQDEEAKRSKATGCVAYPGGGYKSGKVWSVYRIDW